MKRIQNKVAESRRTLPLAILYSIAIWLLAGLIQEQWWIQFGCFLLSAFLMVHLNNLNVRGVSIEFAHRVPAWSKVWNTCFFKLHIVVTEFQQIFLVDVGLGGKQSTGNLHIVQILCLGIASLVDIHILFFVPVFWLMMIIIVYSFSWRTFLASLVGLLTPYWLWVAVALWLENGNMGMIIHHFSALKDFQILGYPPLSFQQTLLVGFIGILGVTGVIHFLRTSTRDKIRTRQMYYSFIIIGLSAFLFLTLQPQHYDMLIRIMIIAVSPLIGHFLALTKTKITNIAFIVISGAVLVITAFNLWTSLSPF